jgi:hypothetical protein
MDSRKMEACSVGIVFIDSKDKSFENPVFQYYSISLFQQRGRNTDVIKTTYFH